jgi:hypothetical protein
MCLQLADSNDGQRELWSDQVECVTDMKAVRTFEAGRDDNLTGFRRPAPLVKLTHLVEERI